MTNTTNETRIGDWMQSASGIQFWPLDPRPEEIRLEDIVHALSNTCRFGGHTREFYSVAQHSVICAQLLAAEPAWIRLSALMHDATEAYLVDVPRPIKLNLPEYRKIEDRLADVIVQWFDREYNFTLHFDHPRVKWADETALATEARDLLGPKPAPWRYMPTPASFTVVPLPPAEAKQLFIDTFVELAEITPEADR